MDKKIGLFWLRDDFRFVKNLGLIEATTKHNQVVVFYLYKKDIFDNQEGQKWWLSKSLSNFKKKLNELNITLEIVETNSFKIFFDDLIKKKDFAIYWNKVYEPDYLKFDEYLLSIFKNKNIYHKRFKGNALNEIDEVKKISGIDFMIERDPSRQRKSDNPFIKGSIAKLQKLTQWQPKTNLSENVKSVWEDKWTPENWQYVVK